MKPSLNPENVVTISMSAELLIDTLSEISKHVDRCRSASHMTADYTREDSEWQRNYLRDSVLQDLTDIDVLMGRLRNAARGGAS